MATYIPPWLEESLQDAPRRKGKGEGPHIGQIIAIAVVVGFTLFFIAVFIAIVTGGGQA
jgi:hypothetical protein